MCIAILKPSGTEISDEYLRNCFERNRDGAGIAYAHDGKLYINKGIFDEDKFVAIVRQAEKLAEGAMLIHCRIGTHGLKDKNNCHPHVVNNRCVLIHNGILNIDVPRDSEESDTIHFIKRYLKPLSRDFMRDDAICDLIEKAIGSGNKFVLLNHKGEYRIINEKAGHWEKGIWYSNKSYESLKFSNVPPITKYDKEWQKYPLFRKQEEVIIDEERVVKNIQSLSNFEILHIGEYPVLDLVTYKLLPESDETMEHPNRYRYLDDISDTAYEEYCYEIEMRGLIHEFEEQEELDKAG